MTVVATLTPELQPMIGGIADYAAILGEALRQRGVEQSYLVAGKRACEHRMSILQRFPDAIVLDTMTSDSLLSGLAALEPETVFLQYSGYGYAARGAPFWLAKGLEHWKALGSRHRLVVMFHETWASGLPWQSSFWVSSQQRSCARRIAQLADAVVTNTNYYRSRLQRLIGPKTPIQVQPIFSNIGEPDAVPGFTERDSICVLFGLGATRRRTHERFRPYFDQLRMLDIEHLIEIGGEPEITAGLAWPFPAVRLGPCKASEVSAMMTRVKYGVFECPVHIAGKSGVLAALAAHGIVPIHPQGQGPFDGLEFGRDTVNLSAVTDQPNAHAPDGASVRAWYRKHHLDRQVRDTWLRLLS